MLEDPDPTIQGEYLGDPEMDLLWRKIDSLQTQLLTAEISRNQWLVRCKAAEAREKALRDVLNEALRIETVRDLHDWLERAKKGKVT
jgi:hypothetical protein